MLGATLSDRAMAPCRSNGKKEEREVTLGLAAHHGLTSSESECIAISCSQRQTLDTDEVLKLPVQLFSLQKVRLMSSKH